ncbi:MAG: glycosyltransferase family 4 protein [Acidimicrobiia bacterium]
MFLRAQLAHLAQNGYEVSLGTNLGQKSQGRLPRFVKFHHIAYCRQPSAMKDIAALVATIRLIRRTRPDLVNASTPKAGLIGLLAARVCRVPARVYVVRGFRFETMVGWRRRVFRLAERIALNCATNIIFNSPSLRRVAESNKLTSPGMGHVLRNGVSPSRLGERPSRTVARHELGIPDSSYVIGYVGRLTRDKGTDDLVQALRLLNDDAVHLLLIGALEDGDPILDVTLADIQANRQITWVRWMDDPLRAYAAMDVLAFPSYREGLPNVPLEAAACALPVVAYAATGTVDAVVHGVTGLLGPIGDLTMLVSHLRRLQNDRQLAESLGKAGDTWARTTFDEGEVVTELANLYRLWLPAR